MGWRWSADLIESLNGLGIFMVGVGWRRGAAPRDGSLAIGDGLKLGGSNWRLERELDWVWESESCVLVSWRRLGQRWVYGY